MTACQSLHCALNREPTHSSLSSAVKQNEWLAVAVIVRKCALTCHVLGSYLNTSLCSFVGVQNSCFISRCHDKASWFSCDLLCLCLIWRNIWWYCVQLYTAFLRFRKILLSCTLWFLSQYQWTAILCVDILVHKFFKCFSEAWPGYCVKLILDLQCEPSGSSDPTMSHGLFILSLKIWSYD